MPGPITKPTPHIEPDVPPVAEPVAPLPGPGPDMVPEPEPGTPPREPASPKPGEPVPHAQDGLADPRALTSGPARHFEPGGELSRHPVTELQMNGAPGQPQPNPPSEPTPPPPPRPESVPHQPGRPMEDPMAPKPGPPQSRLPTRRRRRPGAASDLAGARSENQEKPASRKRPLWSPTSRRVELRN
jgi:hypothetical protein